MKLNKIFTIGTLALLSLTSCELKNDLMGSLVDKEDTGAIELEVNVKQPVSQTRTTKAEVSTDNFPITIQGTSAEVTDILKQYETLAEMPASINVPVGQYTISSHTPGDLEKKMDSPYYAGSTDITVSKGIATQANVECRMANSRIQMQYGDDFKEAFSSWNITVDDGSETVLAYTESDSDPEAIYWHFGDNVTSITVNIRAVTNTGNTVSERRAFQKGDATQQYEEVNENFTGGDALVITMGTVESSTGELEGIEITTDITFEDAEESVEIPTTEPEEQEPTVPEEPEEGGEETNEAVTLQLPADVTYSISAGNAPASADAFIASEAGLDKIIVTITAGNQAFQDILVDLKMDGQSFLAENGGVNLIDNSNFNELVATVGSSAPTDGIKEYTFPISAFFNFLDLTGATDAGKSHEFHITVTDKNGESASGVFKITINE